MSLKYQISKEGQSAISAARKNNKNKNADKRLEVLEMRAEGYKDGQIAEKTGFHKKYVSALVVKYVKEGLGAIVHTKQGGNRRNLNVEEEKELLAEFSEKARQGQLVSVSEIKEKYDEKIGHTSGNGTIYRVLARHRWRKAMPRGRHPKKADNEAVEASKKLTML